MAEASNYLPGFEVVDLPMMSTRCLQCTMRAPATNQPISDLSNRQLLDSIEKSLSNLSLRYSVRNSIVLVYHLFL